MKRSGVIKERILEKERSKNFEITRAALTLEPRIRVIIAGRKSSFMQYRQFGARGYLEEYGVQSDLPDSIGGLFYGGTADIQRVVIARLLGL